MLKKIKDLMEIKDIINDMSSKFEDNAKTVMKLSNDIESMNKELDSLKDSQRKLVTELKKDSESIRDTKEDFRNEIIDFKLVKSRLEKKLVEKFEEEIKEDLVPRFERLEKHVKGFEDLGDNVALITKRVVGLSSELQKFTDISENIKKGDFELTKFAGHMKGLENEKLELMRKIDTMERLVSKMRRSR